MSAAETDQQTILGPELAGTLMTPEEFDAVLECDELFVYELIQGVLIVSPPPSEGERGPNQTLGHWLLTYKDRHPQGSAMDCVLPEHLVRTLENRRRADLVIWAGLGRMPNVRRERPTIIVEFVSAGKRDRQRDYFEKRREYLAIGVTEYWVIDRFRRQMTIYRQPIDSPEIVIQEKEVYSTSLLPGFELPLDQLFRVADQLESDEQS